MCLQLVLGLLSLTETVGEWGLNVEEFEESLGLFNVDRGTVNLYRTT